MVPPHVIHEIYRYVAHCGCLQSSEWLVLAKATCSNVQNILTNLPDNRDTPFNSLRHSRTPAIDLA